MGTIIQGVVVPWGQLSRGQLSHGGSCPGGSCSGGSCSGGSCPVGSCPEGSKVNSMVTILNLLVRNFDSYFFFFSKDMGIISNHFFIKNLDIK